MAAIRPHSARPHESTTELEKGYSKVDITSSDPFSLTKALIDTQQQKQRAVKRFYGRQNEQIKSMLLSVDQHRMTADDEASAKGLKNRIAIYGSLVGNLMLAGLQLYGAVSSGSLSLFATMVDSIFDPVSNGIMLYCHRSARHADETRWPSGKARMTTVGNICFCFIMACASAILIVESIREIVSHVGDVEAAATEQFHLSSVLAVTGAFITKVCLMLYCWPLKSSNSQIQILWEDHRNDLFINGLGIVTSVLGSKVVWWLDPGGAMLLSVLIIASWGNTCLHEFKLLIGVSASPEFLQLVTYTCVTHHRRVLQLDTCRAYHSGEGIIIEVDIVMAKELTLGETHDVAEDLQNKLERLPGVERCFVHCDFETTHKPEHRKNI
ncbi:protein of unknown function [Taphrina deformans PYCC 5710]|uniref:Uncharacterized protein n=1 Tax=Taphrina deformans (strain PYCC 5710 / ATCC 11124 / CBS 356.35 / IMI 108563 / JCM 9778 / NBRC 8474) TaxID=1097556 RepID=R4XI28_TAPDE|nr:protein of unknown function [Taphrina deformans PYCC 5710]|eukprot:CCG84134.1 protein of unknown function [Taphrina deformans PYCC 5710]